MSNDHGDWAAAFADAVHYILSGLGFVASSVCIWIGATYRKHIAMLLRHDHDLDGIFKEKGLEHAFREKAGKGPIGEGITAEITKLEQEDELLHRRVSNNQDKLANLITQVAEIKTDIKWIREELQRRRDKE